MGRLTFRPATLADVPALAAISVEVRMGADGYMSPAGIRPGMASELAEELRFCMRDGCEGVIFSSGSTPVGFALFRRCPDHVQLIRFSVIPAQRNQSAGVEAFRWLWENEWADSPVVRRDVGPD